MVRKMYILQWKYVVAADTGEITMRLHATRKFVVE